MQTYTVWPLRQDSKGGYTSAGTVKVRAENIENLRRNMIAKYKGQFQALYITRTLPNGRAAKEDYQMILDLPDGIMTWGMRNTDARGRVVTKSWELKMDGTLGERL